MIDTAGEPMRVAIAPWLEIDLQGQERFEALLFPAIEQALGAAVDGGERRPSRGLALGLPAPRPGLAGESRGKAARQRARSDFQVDSWRTAYLEAAMRPACSACTRRCARWQTGAFDACVVAGVESYLSPETLEWLEENDQLHGAGSAEQRVGLHSRRGCWRSASDNRGAR